MLRAFVRVNKSCFHPSQHFKYTVAKKNILYRSRYEKNINCSKPSLYTTVGMLLVSFARMYVPACRSPWIFCSLVSFHSCDIISDSDFIILLLRAYCHTRAVTLAYSTLHTRTLTREVENKNEYFNSMITLGM